MSVINNLESSTVDSAIDEMSGAQQSAEYDSAPSQAMQHSGGPSESKATFSSTMAASRPVASSAAPTHATVRTIVVTAANFKFTPSTINVEHGENVELQLVGLSGVHGFMVPDFAINQPVAAGETVTVTLPTDKAGSFDFLCSIPAGSGHAGMNGKIIVQ